MKLIYTLPCGRNISAHYVYKLNKFLVRHMATVIIGQIVFQMIDEYFGEPFSVLDCQIQFRQFPYWIQPIASYLHF